MIRSLSTALTVAALMSIGSAAPAEGPNFPTEHAMSCGHASVYMMLSLSGIDFDRRTLASHFPDDPGPATMLHLRNVLTKFGISTTGTRMPLDQLLRSGHSAILHLRKNDSFHFVVACSRDGKLVILDPVSRSPLTLEADDQQLESIYSGSALVMSEHPPIQAPSVVVLALLVCACSWVIWQIAGVNARKGSVLLATVVLTLGCGGHTAESAKTVKNNGLEAVSLVFPEGTNVNLGDVDNASTPLLALSFRNEGDSIDLGSIHIGRCCVPCSVVSQSGTVERGDSGQLRIMLIAGKTAGPQRILLPLVLRRPAKPDLELALAVINFCVRHAPGDEFNLQPRRLEHQIIQGTANPCELRMQMTSITGYTPSASPTFTVDNPALKVGLEEWQVLGNTARGKLLVEVDAMKLGLGTHSGRIQASHERGKFGIPYQIVVAAPFAMSPERELVLFHDGKNKAFGHLLLRSNVNLPIEILEIETNPKCRTAELGIDGRSLSKLRIERLNPAPDEKGSLLIRFRHGTREERRELPWRIHGQPASNAAPLR